MSKRIITIEYDEYDIEITDIIIKISNSNNIKIISDKYK